MTITAPAIRCLTCLCSQRAVEQIQRHDAARAKDAPPFILWMIAQEAKRHVNKGLALAHARSRWEEN